MVTPFRDRNPIPGTPGYVGESSQRHAEQQLDEIAEVRPNQRVPHPGGGGGGAVDDRLEQHKGTIQDETRHDAK